MILAVYVTRINTGILIINVKVVLKIVLLVLKEVINAQVVQEMQVNSI
jgi:hypothetical protein